MNQRIHRIASILLALTLIVTTLPARALPPGLAGLGAGEVMAAGNPLDDTATWAAAMTDNTRSVAWGDVDGDGDLDLAVGNYSSSASDSQNRLYLNTNGELNPDPIWSSSESDFTISVAWGDVDGDGDLDLAVGNGDLYPTNNNAGEPNRLYRNCSIRQVGDGCTSSTPYLSNSAVWSSNESDDTLSVAWGDVDGDGDLDLAVGNQPIYNSITSQYEGGQNRLYRNCTIQSSSDRCALGDTGLQSTMAWSSIERNNTSSVAWGDVDNDGKLDLVAGNDGQPNRIYFNTGGTLVPFAPRYTAEAEKTSSVAWGDVDGDGNLDLAVGNNGQPNRIYIYASGTLSLAWTDPITTTNTISVAWGDADGDGDLDLAIGNSGQPNQIYINNSVNGTISLSLSWSAAEIAQTNSVAWGDVDGDGDIDLAAGNNASPHYGGGPYIIGYDPTSWIYTNTTTTMFASRVSHFGDQPGISNSMAWGDVDGDGDLDLAIGSYIYSAMYTDRNKNILYLNNDEIFSAEWSSSEGDNNSSLAWGDVDGDGDLDLAAGNDGQPLRLYRNCRVRQAADGCVGGDSYLSADAAWSSTASYRTASIAWGDVDDDGDLDLAVGNKGEPNLLYRNQGGALILDTTWSPPAQDTRSLAWADVDGDGDLDLAIGNYEQPNQLYTNVNGKLSARPIWLADESYKTSSLAWGDVDGDGDLDLAIGNDTQPNLLYQNNAGALSARPAWLSNESNSTTSLAWGDVDGDGDLDLADGGQTLKVYTNDGATLRTSAAWSSVNALGSNQVGWVDIDDNGSLDLMGLEGVFTHGPPITAISWYRNERNRAGQFKPPTITISQPLASPALQPAIGMANPQVINRSPVFSYTLRHSQSARATRILAQYSLDGGGSWQAASPAVITATNQLTSSPEGLSHTYTWDTVASGVFGQTDQAVLRLVVDMADPEIPRTATQAVPSNGLPSVDVPGPFFYSSMTSATSLPFRLRGTLPLVVDEQGNPVSDALVYRLPSGQAQGATALTNWLTGAPLPSLASGYVASRDPLLPGDRLAALQVITQTEKFTLYHTSPIDIGSGQPEYQISSTGVQTLTVSPDRPLIAFKLDVALEWDARGDPAFMAQLRSDLARASELLYDWTDGQVVLGKATIYHDKDHWEDVTDPVTGKVTYGADIQIAASNRMRPNSAQGGIVSGNMVDPDISTITYTPGALRMPASWNRNGDPGGTLGEDWPRTLAHEFGHFALFLDDNYLGLDASGNLIPVTSCPGAMGDPYRDLQSEFRPSSDWLPNCAATLSNQISGRSDWATLKRFYDGTVDGFTLNQPAAYNRNPGPRHLALGLLQVTEATPPQSSMAEARNVSLSLSAIISGTQQVYAPSPAARALLYRSDGQRAIDLGAPTGDLLLLRGARNGDHVCVYDSRQSLLGCAVISELSTDLTLTPVGSWRPDLQISAVTSRTVTLRVPADGAGTPAPAQLMVELFPDDGPPITISLTLSNGTYQGQASFASDTLSALIRLWDPAAEWAHESVSEYSLGGDPAPRRRKKGRRRRRAPALSADGQAILFTDKVSFAENEFFSFQTIDQLPAPPDWAVPVGFGYRLLASDGVRTQIGASSLAVSYFAEDVPAGAEAGISVYYYPAGGDAWQRLETTRSPEDNTAAARALGEGIYALMASVPLELDGGWNYLYSYPGADQRLPAALSGSGGYNLVYGYDPGDAADPWQLFAPGLDPLWDGIVNDLRQLEHGSSYWFHATRPVTVPVRPSLTAADPPAGGAMIGIPPATYYGVAPAGLSGPLTVEALVGPDAEPCGSATTTDVRFRGATRPGFSINVLAYGGDAPGCGTPDAAVQLVFRRDGVDLGSYTALWQNEQLNALGIYQLYLPHVASRGAPAPDLQVVDVQIVPTPAGAGEDYAVAVTVRNAGDGAADAPFWVDLYIDPARAPLPGEGWAALGYLGASWRVYALDAGETLTLSSLEPNDPLDPGRNYSALPLLLDGASYTLYAQADVYGGSGGRAGALAEHDEANNIAGPYVLTAGE